MLIVNWSLFLISISVHARFGATLLPSGNQGFKAVLSFQSASPFGSTPHDRRSLEHSNTEVVPREPLSQRSETGARDEYEELTHSYSVRRLAHWIRLSSNATFHLCYDFNFFVLLALIYWKGRPRLTAALQARSRLILRTMEQAQQLSKDARRRLAKVEALWAQLDSKIAAIGVVADAEMERLEQGLLATAEEEQRRISENVQREVAGAAERARNELKEFAADLAVSIARQVIEIDESTDQELIRAVVTALDQTDKTP
jgi:F0F1-type ATP synthase membrane subunit b/b'